MILWLRPFHAAEIHCPTACRIAIAVPNSVECQGQIFCNVECQLQNQSVELTDLAGDILFWQS